MTREEVIKDLRYIKNMNHNSLWQSSAIDEAIKALENQKTLREELEKIKAEFEEKESKLNFTKVSDVALKTAYIEVAKVIDKHISELKGE